LNIDWAEADLPIVEGILKLELWIKEYEELVTKLINSKINELDKDSFQVKKLNW
jgi:hypothetical protein